MSYYNHRGKAEQYIKEGKHTIKWARLSCLKFHNNEVRLKLHALSYNLANFMRTLAFPEAVEHWSLTTLQEKRMKISAKVVRQGRYASFQLAEVAVPRNLFEKILDLIKINDLRRRAVLASAEEIDGKVKMTGKARLHEQIYGKKAFRSRPTHQKQAFGRRRRKKRYASGAM